MLDQTPATVVAQVLHDLNDALTKPDPKAAARLFETDGYWRDLASLTWNIKTMEGQDQIEEMLKAQIGPIQTAGLHDHARRGGGGWRRVPPGLDRLRDRAWARARPYPHP